MIPGENNTQKQLSPTTLEKHFHKLYTNLNLLKQIRSVYVHIVNIFSPI